MNLRHNKEYDSSLPLPSNKEYNKKAHKQRHLPHEPITKNLLDKEPHFPRDLNPPKHRKDPLLREKDQPNIKRKTCTRTLSKDWDFKILPPFSHF